MSKPLSSRLTASKKRRRRRLEGMERVECLDVLADCHSKLAALAALMVACSEAMEAGQMRGLGVLVTDEVCRLEELLAGLGKAAR